MKTAKVILIVPFQAFCLPGVLIGINKEYTEGGKSAMAFITLLILAEKKASESKIYIPLGLKLKNDALILRTVGS